MFLKSLTFHWLDWWGAQDTVPSLAHLATGCQEHPPVSMTQLPAAPQSGGALASSWPTPQWFESPGHLLHLGGTTGKLNCQSSKRKDGSWSAALLIHVGHHHQMIMLLRAAWGQAGTSALTIRSVRQGLVCEICEIVSEGRPKLWIIWGVYVIKKGDAETHWYIGAMCKCVSIHFPLFACQ